jgi:hypothetical protein
MPLERLTRDPSQDVQPDFRTQAYAAIRDIMTAGGNLSEEEAMEALTASWTRDHEERMERWGEQQREEEARAEEVNDQQREEAPPRRQEPPNPPVREEQAPRAISPPASENEEPPAEARSKKLNPLRKGKEITPSSIAQPSAYALRKLKNKEYIELWYFTEKGCEDARGAATSVPSDVFAISRVAGSLALRSLDATTASKAMIPDENLSMMEIIVAQKLLLQHMQEQGWPQDYVASLAQFFLELIYHDIHRNSALGEQIIIRYQAQVRREWHSVISSPKKQDVFDIGVISSKRLDEIERQIIRDNHLALSIR